MDRASGRMHRSRADRAAAAPSPPYPAAVDAPAPRTSPQNSANSAPPIASCTATGRSGPVAKPSSSPHSTSHGAVPSASSTALRASATTRRPAAARARRDDRPAQPQPGDAADDDAGELERAVRGQQPQERRAVARAEREPAHDAEDRAVEQQREHGPAPARIPPANAVSVTWMLLTITCAENAAAVAGVVVAALRRRVGGRLQLARARARAPRPGRSPPTAAPAAAGASSSSHATSDQQRALGEPPPVAAREERAQPSRRAAPARRPRRGRPRRAPRAARRPGRPGSGGGRRRGRRPRRGRARRAPARPRARAARAGRPRGRAPPAAAASRLRARPRTPRASRALTDPSTFTARGV